MPMRYPSPLLTGGSGFLQGFSSVLTEGIIRKKKEEGERQAALRETIIKAVTQKPELLDDPETQKLLTKGIPKETQPVFLNLLRAIGQGGPFEQASRSEQSAFRGATTAPPEGGPTMPAGEFLQRETPAGAALLVGDKRAYLAAREKEMGSGKATGFAALQAQRDRAVASGDYAAAAELQARIKVLTTPPAEAAAARTTAVEQAKLDPALVQKRLNVTEQENLRKIAPAGTLKMLRTKDGKDVPAGSLTNEQVLAMTKSGDLVPKQTVQDQFLSVASRLLFGEDLFTGHGTSAGGAPAAEPAGVPAGAGWTWTPAE